MVVQSDDRPNLAATMMRARNSQNPLTHSIELLPSGSRG